MSEQDPINLRELLKAAFGVDFPISGGTGSSRDSPIVIHYRIPNHYVGLEYGVLNCLSVGRGVTWKLLRASLLPHMGRQIEEMKIEVEESIDGTLSTRVENYYFDLTECFGRRS